MRSPTASSEISLLFFLPSDRRGGRRIDDPRASQTATRLPFGLVEGPRWGRCMMRSVASECCNLGVDLEGPPSLRSHPDTVIGFEARGALPLPRTRGFVRFDRGSLLSYAACSSSLRP